MSLGIERSDTVNGYTGLKEREELLVRAKFEFGVHVREMHPRAIPTSCHSCLNIQAVIRMQELSIREFKARAA